MRKGAYMREIVMRVRLDEGAYLPERFHATDAGADIRTPKAFTLKAHGSEIVKTGVHVELPPDTVGMIKSKSRLNVFYDIVSEGVIDEGFSGEILVKLYNLGDRDYHFEAGDKITQLVVMPVCYPTFIESDVVMGGARGDAGYGSTGR